jgi:hypothetical protein
MSNHVIAIITSYLLMGMSVAMMIVGLGLAGA